MRPTRERVERLVRALHADAQRTRGTTTEVVISNLHIGAEIEDHAFSLQALESQRPLALEE